MRGTRAKQVRRVIYGAGGTGRTRQLHSTERPRTFLVDRVNWAGVKIGKAFRRIWTGHVMADSQRQAYQAVKRARRGMSWRTV